MIRTRKNQRFLAWTSNVTLVLFVCLELFQFGGLASQAMAQEGGVRKRVSVFVLPATESDVRTALLLGRILRENTKGLSGIELVTPAPVANAGALPTVIQAVDEAHKFINGKRVEEALARLMEIKPTLDQILPLVPLRTLAIYYKVYGVSQYLLGNLDEGRKSIEISLTLWREQSNLEYAYSVEVLKLFTEVVGDLDSRASVKLRVTTQPENAVVILDGREPSQSPAMFSNVAAGPHLVRVIMDGYEQFAGFYVVKANQENVYSVSLNPIPQKDEFDTRLVAVAQLMKKPAEEARGALLELRSFLSVDELLVLDGSVLGENFELAGFHVKGDSTVFPVKRRVPRDATFLAAIREFLSGLLEAFFELPQQAEGLGGPPIDPALLEKAGITADQGLAVFDPDNPVFPTVERKKKEKTSIFATWWFWTGVGVLVAGGATAGIILGTMDSGDSGPTGNLELHVTPID